MFSVLKDTQMWLQGTGMAFQMRTREVSDTQEGAGLESPPSSVVAQNLEQFDNLLFGAYTLGLLRLFGELTPFS